MFFCIEGGTMNEVQCTPSINYREENTEIYRQVVVWNVCCLTTPVTVILHYILYGRVHNCLTKIRLSFLALKDTKTRAMSWLTKMV